MTTATESFVRITYTTPENELTPAEKAVRARFDAAFNQVMEQFIQESRLQDVLAIELYPCDDQCSDCEA